MKWLRLAAEQEHRLAEYVLKSHLKYLESLKTKADYNPNKDDASSLFQSYAYVEKEAFKGSGEWGVFATRYSMRDEYGEAEADYYVGMCYYEGNGVFQDYAEAAKYFRLAAEQGHKEARAMLKKL